MKKSGFRKLNFLIAIGGIFAALALGGCENLLSSTSSSDDSAPVNFFPPAGNVENGYGIVRGVLPQNVSASTRSAMPSTAAISSYRVFAQNGSTTIEASVDNSNGTFLISLPYGTWNITANGLLANGRVIFTQTQRIVVSTSELNVSFKLGYSTNPDDGEGEMSLTVKFPPSGATSTITGIEYTLTKGGNSKTVAVDSADVAAGTFTIERTTEDLGTYNLTIKCYGDFNNLVYRIDEIVNVYANLTTDKFVGSAPYISGGDIVITQAMLDEFQQATLYVNATIGNDSNNGTQFDPLRTFNRAVELVNNSTRPADTEFRIFLQSDVVDGAELELKAGKKLTVANAGNTIHTITSLNGTFTVAATSTLTAQSMQFQKVRFMVNGMFEMNGGTISGNEVNSNGGAIYIKAGGQATISNGATISGNTTSLNGGGVYVDSGTFTMTGGEISDNTATEAGGAIYIKAGGQATITDGATISGNTATGGNGGGILNIGTLAITDSTISNCTTGNAGSGICNSTMSASASITNCTISGCRGSTSSTYGGGIYVGGGTLSLDGCTIGGDSESDGCTAKNGGGINIDGGTLTFTGSTTTIKNCTATTFGGGIYIKTAAAITNCTIESCKITATTGTVGGGGIYNAGGTAAAPVTITGCTIKQCTSETRGYGGGIYNAKVLAISGGEITDCKSKQSGGGIFNYGSSTAVATLTVNNTTISGCESNALGGGICNDGTATVTDCTVESCSTTSSNGGGISNYGGTLTVSGGTVSNCTAERSDGGGIYSTTASARTSVFAATGVTVSKCTAKSGGGIYTTTPSAMIDSCIITGCTATYPDYSSGGGGIYESGDGVTIKNCTIGGSGTGEGNTAAYGGGLYCNRTLTITGGTIIGNTATVGGGIRTQQNSTNETKITLDGVTITKNTAERYGGGVYNSSNNGGVYPILIMNGGEISQNTSGKKGGGIYNEGRLTVNSGMIFDNTATEKGGDILHWRTEITLAGTTFVKDIYIEKINQYASEYYITAAPDLALAAGKTVCATISLDDSEYTADRQVLQAVDGGTITGDICGKFAMAADPNGIEWGIAPDGTGTKGILKQSTLYVRGTGAGWYEDNPTYNAAAGNDTNSGSKSAPFATIQKAIETALAMNDGTSEYTIYVDGTITDSAAGANGMGDISPTNALNLKIQSMSATTNATLDAEGSGRVLNINANAAVTLKNVNITNGTTADNGGGISNEGSLTIDGGAITNCTTAEGKGGGIYNSGTLTMEGGSITNCTANTSTVNGGWGGGIYNEVTDASITCTLTDCTITGCKATSSSSYGWGGGICNKAGTLKLTNVNITGGGDTANPDVSGIGGGVWNDGTLTITGGTIKNCVSGIIGGGGGICTSGTLTCTGVTIENCITRSSRGGGILIKDSSVIATLTDCTISGCKTLATEYRDYRDGGGGINNNGGILTLSGGIITGCSSVVGGGIVTIGGEIVITGGAEISGNKIEGSTAENNGGGIKIQSGNVTLENGTISDNESVHWGGGVYVAGTSIFTMKNGTVSGNTAKSGGGIGIWSRESAGNVTITGGTITNNTVSEYGGGVYNLGTLIQNGGEISNNTAASGGGVHNANTYVIDGRTYDTIGKFTMSGGTISSNTAIVGGGIYNNVTTTSITTTLTNCEITGCKVTGTGQGGGIYNLAGTLELSGVTITGGNSTASPDATEGGGIYNSAGCALTIKDSTTISACVARTAGGGVWNAGTLTMQSGAKIENNTVVGDTTTGDGGGVYNYSNGTFTMDGAVTISRNTATYGGGVHNSGTFTIKDGTISNNRATGSNDSGGGGIHLYNGSVTMVGGTISDNEATGTSDDSGGGGLYIYTGKTFTMSGGTFSGNTATKGNGAFVAKSGILYMSGAANFASDDDVYLYDKTGASGVSPTICVAGALTGTTPVATITPFVYAVGKQVLSAGAGITITADICDKFALSELGWMIDKNGCLAVTDIYVSSTGNDTTGNGTASAPYKTLQKAFDRLKAEGSSTVSYQVHISGTVSGTTTVASGLPAAKVLITGTSSASDILDGNNTGTVLTVNCTAPIEIKNVKITSGTATDGGGIIVNAGASLEMIGGTISNCAAVNRGGGVFVNSGTFKMSGTTEITNCWTTLAVNTSYGGGGIYNEGGTVEIAGGTISGCTAARSGGGVCVHSNGTLTMTGGEITGNGNSSMTYGGGVYVNGGTFIMRNGSINANMAQMGAGVRLYNNSTIFTMSGGEIIGNTATDYCGGVYVNQGTFTITGGTITGNTGNGSGNKAGVYVLSGTFNNNGGTVQSD